MLEQRSGGELPEVTTEFYSSLQVVACTRPYECRKRGGGLARPIRTLRWDESLSCVVIEKK